MSVPLPTAQASAATSQPIPRREEAPAPGSSYKASGTPSSFRGNVDNWRTAGASPTRNGTSKPERTVGFSSRGSVEAAAPREGGIGAAKPKAAASKKTEDVLANGEEKKDKVSLSHVPCRFFKAGACTAGDNCPFSHAPPEPGKKKEVCQWFIKGNCKFGHKCALAHILPGQTLSDDRKNKKAAQQSNATGGVPISGGARSSQARRSGAVGSYEAGSAFPSSLTGNSMLGQQSSYGKSVAAASPSAIPMPTARREPYGPPSEDAAGSPSAGFGRSIDRGLVTGTSFTGYSASPNRPSPLTGLRSADSDVYRARPLSVPGPLAARSLRSGSFTAEQLASSPSRSLHPPASAGPQANAFSSSPFTAPGKTGVFFSQSYGQDSALLGNGSPSGARPISASFANETSFSKSIWARKPQSLVEAGEDLSPNARGQAFRRPDSATRRTSDVFAVDEEDSEDEYGAGRYNDAGDSHEEDLLPSSLSELLTPRENARRLLRRDSQNNGQQQPIGISTGFTAYGRSLDADSVFARQAQSASAAVGVGGGGFLKNLWNDDGVDQRKAAGGSPATADPTSSGFQLGPSHASVAFLPNFGNRSASLLTQQQPSPPSVTTTSPFSPVTSPLSPLGAQDSYPALPLPSPGTRALQSHAPGQSLPQGLAAGLSRLHLQPAKNSAREGEQQQQPTSSVPLPRHVARDEGEDEELFAMDG